MLTPASIIFYSNHEEAEGLQFSQHQQEVQRFYLGFIHGKITLSENPSSRTKIERKLGGGGRLGLIWSLGLEEKFIFILFFFVLVKLIRSGSFDFKFLKLKPN
jgi:hypothetical protein